jgi:hypothetical protein
MAVTHMVFPLASEPLPYNDARARMHWMIRPLAQTTMDLPPWLLLIAAALAGVLLWRTLAPPSWRSWRWPAAGGESQRSDPLARPQQPSLAQQRSVERDMQTLMHELSEMSRKIIGQLDARSAKLQELLKQADEKIERLAALEARPREQAAPPPLTSMPELNIEIDPRHEQIYALDAEGLSVGQISTRLDMQESEVELVLALHPRRRAAV